MASRRETITQTSEARYVHADVPTQEFAVVQLRLEPLPRGAGVEFVSEAPEIRLPAPLRVGVERGVRQAAMCGEQGLAVVDFRAVLIDGAYHDLDSTPEAFATAAQGAFRAALRAAAPIILF